MKTFKVIVTHRQTKSVLLDTTMQGSTEKSVKTALRIRYPMEIIKLTRLTKPPGVQVDLEDMIKEIEDENPPTTPRN